MSGIDVREKSEIKKINGKKCKFISSDAQSCVNVDAFEGRREWLTSLTMTRRFFVESKNIEFVFLISKLHSHLF